MFYHIDNIYINKNKIVLKIIYHKSGHMLLNVPLLFHYLNVLFPFVLIIIDIICKKLLIIINLIFICKFLNNINVIIVFVDSDFVLIEFII